jgi:hypothetical protein
MLMSMQLLYTFALDPPDSRFHARIAKLLVGSLQKTAYSGDIVVFRNSPEPIFHSQRSRVEEIFLPEPHEGWSQSMAYKWKLIEQLDVERYSTVFFVDCDCIALRNLGHLLRRAK